MNTAEIIQAFAEGLALIVSPCILPVLPLVLATSIEGGRARPFGIIIGFILSFSAFALLSRELINALNIDLDYIKYGSLVLLTLFGLILLSKTLSDKFASLTQGLANKSATLPAQAQGGFVSGLAIGALIGLVWTPCAGPILAAVLVQVIRQQDSLQALPILLAFSLGAGVPMLLISLFGRSLVQRLGFFTRHAEGLRKTFGVLILAAVAFLATGIDPQTLFQNKSLDEKVEIAPSGLKSALANPYDAPKFTGIEAWLNSKPLTMQALKGKVVLVDFWTYSCINCVRTFPHLKSWDEKYRDKGLVIIGVHAPEFEFEKKIDNVKAAIAKNGISYPVAIDNNLDTWSAFNNQYWPAHYLIDKEGKVVYRHFGEGEYAQTENNIRFLLGLKERSEEAADEQVYQDGQTPETYLGLERAESFANTETVTKDKVQDYRFPKGQPTNAWALSGKWSRQNEKITAEGAGAALRIIFEAKKVFLVLGTRNGNPIDVTLKLNGHPVGVNAGKDAPGGKLIVTQHTLYELVDQKEFKSGVLQIISTAPGLEAYAFTFGS